MSPWMERWTEPLPVQDSGRTPKRQRIVQRTDGRREAK